MQNQQRLEHNIICDNHNIIFIIILLFVSINLYSKTYFYKYDYGSVALNTPLNIILNRGFEVFVSDRFHWMDYNYNGSILYHENIKNITHSLLHPIDVIGYFGWKDFFTQEIFPLSFTPGKARWEPNYMLHLFGGIMQTTYMQEYFEKHNYRYPRIYAASLTFIAALINESLENFGRKFPNSDAVADIYFFDIPGIILAQFDGVKEFFSTTISLADWSSIPGIRVSDINVLHNTQNISIRIRLFNNNLYFLDIIGMRSLFGLSYQFIKGHYISFALGPAKKKIIYDKDRNYVQFTFGGGLYYDKNQSLLCSIEYMPQTNYLWNINLYPGWIKPFNVDIGFWLAYTQNNEVKGGLLFRDLLTFSLTN